MARLSVAFCILCVVIGCAPKATETSTAVLSSPLERMRAAANAGDWQSAWREASDVLIQSEMDASTLEFVAEVAFKSGHPSEAADLLVDATHSESFANPPRAQRAFTALITIGRLFDAIELLRQGLKQQPESDELRRMLFDFLVGTEQHEEALIHARELILKRKFDLELLLALDASDERTAEDQSLKEMRKRNEQDLRPEIAFAKRNIDQGDYAQSMATLRAIVQMHTDFTLAHLMLGRAIVFANRFDDLSAWIEKLPSEASEHADYWLTLGDWAVHANHFNAAKMAFGRSAVLAPSRVEPWTKLASTIQLNLPQNENPPLETDTIFNQQVFAYAANLTQLRQAIAEFHARSKFSPPTAIEISNCLERLGRPWEAEAWLATMLSNPKIAPADKVAVEGRRKEVVTNLHRSTPWQLPSHIPYQDWMSSTGPETILAEVRDRQLQSPRDTIATRSISKYKTPSILPRFRDEAISRGLEFHGVTAGDLHLPGIKNHEMIGCGGAAIDFDLDGWPDAYLVSAGGKPPLQDSEPNALFRNLEGTFRNVAPFAGSDDRHFSHGAAVGDVNEDGFDDLVVLNYGPNSIWINNGDGTFTNQSAQWLPSNGEWSTSAAVADVDGDGITDLIIANYCAGLAPSVEECFSKESNASRACSPNHFPAQPDTFLKGLPEGRFVDVTQSWNAYPSVIGRGLGIVAGSLDQVPGMDVLIANDMTDNHFWSPKQNDESGRGFRLEETGAIRGIANDARSMAQGSMGIAVADLNSDGATDFYVTNYENEYNTLYLSRGNGTWRDATEAANLTNETLPMVGFGTAAIDFDHNGDHELIVANGHVDQYGDGTRSSAYAQPIQLFQRQPNGSFAIISNQIECSYFQNGHVGRALWMMDANRDGLTDVAITHQTEPVSLLINNTDTANHYLHVRLVGTNSSRSGVGAAVEVHFESEKRIAMAVSGDGFLTSHERRLSFGLGRYEAPVSITVRWLDGSVQTWDDVQPNQEWLLIQGESAYPL